MPFQREKERQELPPEGREIVTAEKRGATIGSLNLGALEAMILAAT